MFQLQEYQDMRWRLGIIVTSPASGSEVLYLVCL